MKTDLSQFDARKHLDRGRSRIVEIIWYAFKMLFFLTAFPWPVRLKVAILRLFGASVGKGVNIKPRVNILFPWKLVMGNSVWLGEEVFILNFEKIILEDNSCISQRAFLCGGNHDYRSVDFAYRNQPIHVKSGAWVGAQVFVGPGVTVGAEAVITAGSIVTDDIPDNKIASGNPCQILKERWKANG